MFKNVGPLKVEPEKPSKLKVKLPAHLKKKSITCPKCGHKF